MDYRDLVFIAVAENLSFSKAAEELNISQPAVTRHIKELEVRYHTNLFDRKGNKIYLTADGKRIYDSYKQIEQQYRDLEFEIYERNNETSGDFIIGASTTIAQYFIPRIIAGFHKRYPRVNILLVSGNSFEIEQLLISNKVDVALVENQSSRSGITYRVFLEDELIVVTGADSIFAKRKSITKSDLLQIPIVLREQGSGTLEVLRDAFVRNNLDFEKLNVPIHLGSTEAIKNFLLSFDGVAILSRQTVHSELYLKTLVELKVSGFQIFRAFRLAIKTGHKSRQIELFEKILFGYNV